MKDDSEEVKKDGYWIEEKFAGRVRWWVVLLIISLSIVVFLVATRIIGV